MGDWAYPGFSAGHVFNGPITNNAAVDVISSWTELEAPTDHPVAGVMLNVTQQANNNHNHFDLGIGAAASEVAIVEEIIYEGGAFGTGNPEGGQAYPPITLPIQIPASTRVAGNPIGGTDLLVGIHFWTPTFAHNAPGGRVVIEGYDTADHGTSVAQGNGSKGSWTQITASTAHNYRAIALITQTAGASVTDADFMLDLGVGAASSETVVLPDIAFQVNSDLQSSGNNWQWYPLQIPAGTRVSARIQSDVASQTFYVAFMGLAC